MARKDEQSALRRAYLPVVVTVETVAQVVDVVVAVIAAVDFAASEAVALAEVGQGVDMVGMKFGIVDGSRGGQRLVRQGGDVARALRTVVAVPSQSHVIAHRRQAEVGAAVSDCVAAVDDGFPPHHAETQQQGDCLDKSHGQFRIMFIIYGLSIMAWAVCCLGLRVWSSLARESETCMIWKWP